MAASAEETVILIGGPRNGTDKDVLAGSNMYLDFHSSTYYLRRKLYAVTVSPVTGKPTKAWGREVFLHQSIQSPQQANALLAQVLLNRWIVDGGEEPIPDFAPDVPTNGNGSPQ